MKFSNCARLFTFTALFVVSFTVNSQKNLLYVSSGGPNADPRTSDMDMVDSLESWGFIVTHLQQGPEVGGYNAIPDPYDGMDGVFFGNVGSTSIARFGPNPEPTYDFQYQDNFPLNAICLEAAALMETLSRWDLYAEDGGIRVPVDAIPDPEARDLIVRIVDTDHYITSIFDLNEEVAWSSAPESRLLPFYENIRYHTDILAMPIITEFNVPDADPFSIGVINDVDFPVKIFLFGVTHPYLLDAGHATPDYFRIIRRAAEYLFDAMQPPSPLDSINIVLVTPDDRDNRQYQFLKAQGFSVDKYWPGHISIAGQEAIDYLNDAHLVIIGKSGLSTYFRNEDADIWNDSIKVPVIINSPFLVTNGPERMNWFDLADAYHAFFEPEIAYVQVSDDDIFSHVNHLDSIPWFYVPHTFLSLYNPTNGTVQVAFGNSSPLFVQFSPGTEMYNRDNTYIGPTPLAPRTFFGFGNDGTPLINFFPLSTEAQQVYFNEIMRLLGLEMQMVIPVAPTSKPRYTISLSVDPPGAGYVSGDGKYEINEEVSIAAEPADGFYFTNWTLSDSLISNSAIHAFSMPSENLILTANFELLPPPPPPPPPPSFSLALDVIPPGSGSVTGAGNYPSGDTVNISANPMPGYIFSFWSNDNEQFSNEHEYYFSMPAKHMILTAYFQDQSFTGNKNIANKSLNIFPNPVNELLYIDLPEKHTEVIIQDILGQTVINKISNSEGRVVVDVGFLNAGLYLIIVTDREAVWTERFIKK